MAKSVVSIVLVALGFSTSYPPLPNLAATQQGVSIDPDDIGGVVTEPLPQLKGVTDPGSAEASYYTWVDQFEAFGLGRNVPINTGNGSEGLLALKDGKWVVLRVPYPLGFFTKWMDGRVDNATAGWKGRELWATVSTRAPFHMKGGKGTTSKVLKFQLRPDPLAK